MFSRFPMPPIPPAQENANRLKAYKANLVVFPRRAGKPKAGDASAEELQTAAQLKGKLLPATKAAAALEKVAVTADMKVGGGGPRGVWGPTKGGFSLCTAYCLWTAKPPAHARWRRLGSLPHSPHASGPHFAFSVALPCCFVSLRFHRRSAPTLCCAWSA